MCANAILSACSPWLFSWSLYTAATSLLIAERRTIGIHSRTPRNAKRCISWFSPREPRASGIDCRRVNLKSPLITYFIISLSNYTTESFSFRDGAKFGARETPSGNCFANLLLCAPSFLHCSSLRHRGEKEGEKTRAKKRVRECKKGQERERESCCFINPICNTLNL